MSGTLPPAKRGAELSTSVRFEIDDIEVDTVVYEQGLLAKIGVGRFNQARAAVNLSEGGVMVRTQGRIKSGTKVHVRLEIEKFSDVIEADGVVRWCYQGAHEDRHFYAGIQFLNLPASVASKIAKLRGYYTSPEYRNKQAIKRQNDPIGFQQTR